MMPRDVLPACALAAQLLLQLVWHGVLSPVTGTPMVLVLALALAPMLAVIPAARHSFRRALLVGGIVSLLYFSHGVMELMASPDTRWLAAIEVVLAVIAIFGIRKRPKPA